MFYGFVEGVLADEKQQINSGYWKEGEVQLCHTLWMKTSKKMLGFATCALSTISTIRETAS